MTCTQQKRTPRHAARNTGYRPQLPLLWQESILENARAEAERTEKDRRRKTLYLSIAASLMAGMVARPAAVSATEYDGTITGVADNDKPGGTGNYTPGYNITVGSDGTLHYAFAGGDSMDMKASGRDVFGLSNGVGASPISLDVPSGILSVTAIREQTGAWGLAVGINNAGNTVTVNGDTKIYAQADDSVSGSGSGAHAVISQAGADSTPGNVIFNGATDLQAYSPGYARAVWVSGRSNVTFNGPTTILAQSRGTLDAVYNSQVGSITFNGDTSISALGIWPSDNSHAIYNDGVNSRVTVNGKLALTTVSQGSTAFGVRNQGIMEVAGDTTVNVEGPRSSHGIANTHRLARMTWHGDVDVRVRGGAYVPFGNPSGLSNDRSPGASMRFEGAVNVDVASAAETYGLVSTGTIEFASAEAPVSFTAASTCNGCSVYGIRNFGTVSATGGLTVSTTASGNGAAYSIWSVPLDTQHANVTVNRTGGHTVQLDGDIATATDLINGFIGSVDVNLDTPDSWLHGLVGGRQSDAGFSVGSADLAFSNGAEWIPQGTGTLANDFGSGTLIVGSAGGIDMAEYWGDFEPGAVPTHSYRTLVVDSSDNGATVALDDGAKFLLLSDITGKSGTPTADKIVFGGGIETFSATGTQGVGIVYDPALDDTSWVNASTIGSGTTIHAVAPIGIVDAGAAAGGNAAFSAVRGLDGEWSGTYENALVRFTYTPEVALSADGSQIVLTGITIRGSGGGSGDDDGSPGDGEDDPGNGTGGSSLDGTDEGTGERLQILPSEAVLTAADASDSLLNLWRESGHGSLKRMRGQLRSQGTDQSGVWAVGDGGELTAKTAYSRRYDQDYSSVTVGADRSFAFDASSGFIGLSAGRLQSTANYTQGKGELTGNTAEIYSGWVAGNDAYLLLGAEASSLENRYTARDSAGRSVAGRYRIRANRIHAEGGYPFQLPRSYYVEPQLSLSVGRIGGNDHTTSTGVRIAQDAHDVSFARAGIEVGKALHGARLDGNLYARVSALSDFGNDSRITASKDGGSIVPDSVDRQDTGAEFVLGSDVAFGRKRTRVFFEASGTTGVETERNWGIQAGLRHSW